MKKKIWILNHYAGNMLNDKNGRHYNFAKYLREAGYEPVIFCCNAKHGVSEYFYLIKDLWQEHIAEEIDTPFIFVQGRTYSGNGKQRILNMIDFYFNVKKAIKTYAAQHGKPDVIYASSVHPLTLVAGEQLAKYFGVKCICEIRDLWPESIVCYKGMSRKNPVIFALYQLEKWIYKRADRLIFTMEGGYGYIKERGWEKIIPQEKVVHINNGVDIKEFAYFKNSFQIKDLDLQDPNTFKVVYTGSVRLANNVELLIDTAKELLQRGNTKIQILIFGDGTDRPRLEARTIKENLTNVLWKGRVEKSHIPFILSSCDCGVLIYQDHYIWKYGGSQNKLFEYFASGRPIVANIRMGYSLIEKYNAGISTTQSNPALLADTMEKLCNMSSETYAEYCKNAHLAVEEYDFQKLTEKLKTVIEKL